MAADIILMGSVTAVAVGLMLEVVEVATVDAIVVTPSTAIESMLAVVAVEMVCSQGHVPVVADIAVAITVTGLVLVVTAGLMLEVVEVAPVENK